MPTTWHQPSDSDFSPVRRMWEEEAKEKSPRTERNEEQKHASTTQKKRESKEEELCCVRNEKEVRTVEFPRRGRNRINVWRHRRAQARNDKYFHIYIYTLFSRFTYLSYTCSCISCRGRPACLMYTSSYSVYLLCLCAPSSFFLSFVQQP